jgi:hypothetical protein
MREPAVRSVPRPPGGKALVRLVSELTRVGLDVHAEAAALFGAPAADPVELVADVAGPGYESPGPYLVLQRHFVILGVAVPDGERPPPDHRGL